MTSTHRSQSPASCLLHINLKASQGHHTLLLVSSEGGAALEHLATQTGEHLALMHGVAVVVESIAAAEAGLTLLAGVVPLLTPQKVVAQVVPGSKTLPTALTHVWPLPQVLRAYMLVQAFLCGKNPCTPCVRTGDRVALDVRLVLADAVAVEAGDGGQVLAADVAHVALRPFLSIANTLVRSGLRVWIRQAATFMVGVFCTVCGLKEGTGIFAFFLHSRPACLVPLHLNQTENSSVQVHV